MPNKNKNSKNCSSNKSNCLFKNKEGIKKENKKDTINKKETSKIIKNKKDEKSEKVNQKKANKENKKKEESNKAKETLNKSKKEKKNKYISNLIKKIRSVYILKKYFQI